MNTRQSARGILPVRLNESERVLAEAISRMGGDRSSVGAGVREALRMAEEYFIRDGRGGRLEKHIEEIENERAEGTR